MTPPIRIFGLLAVLAVASVASRVQACAQDTPPQPAPIAEAAPASDRPLPDIDTLMQQVEAQQKASLSLIKNYTYRQKDTEQELDSHGAVKKSTSDEREIYWIEDIRIQKLLARDGKPLSDAERKKMDDSIDQRIAEAKQRQAQKNAGETPKKSNRGYEVTFARFLELGAFSNPRRVDLHGRDTIAVDYNGDPRAKTRNVLEGAIRELSGTVWVDEQDHALVRVEGHFFNDFKLGGGLVADIHKGSSFQAEFTRVNGEVWLPASFSGRGSARIALFFNHTGAVQSESTGYRKFKATAKIVPGFSTPEDPATP